MAKTPSSKTKMGLLLKEYGSTSRVVDKLSDSISECLIDASLPQELITEILVRLPVKSLLRFKCVSKPWLSLISDPQFIRSHFSQSDEVENLEILFTISPTIIKKCSLYSALHEADPSELVTDIKFPVSNMGPIVGIINGLVCLNLERTKFNGTHLCVWNPALNKTKYFGFYPDFPPGSLYYSSFEYIFSFGYEVSNDDYKVVCVHNVENGNDGFDAEVWIYSLKADSWRRIDQLKGFYLPFRGVFANGKIYWTNNQPGLPLRRNIVTLDMSSEKFVELQPPEYDAVPFKKKKTYDAVGCILRIGVSAGRLFVLCDYYQGKKVDLWVLDKRDVEESWRKLVSFPYIDDNMKFGINYLVLRILGNSEIVFGNECGLVVYNWKKKEYRKIKVLVGEGKYVRAAAYVESLVWPNYV